MFAKACVVMCTALTLPLGWAASAPALSRDGLRQCLQQEAALGQAMEALHKGRADRDATTQSLDADEARIKEARATLDRTNTPSVKAYNAMVKAHHRRIATHNRSLRALDAKASAYRAGLATYQSGCAGKAYSESDRAAVLAEKP